MPPFARLEEVLVLVRVDALRRVECLATRASPAVFDPNLVTKGKKVPTDYFFFSLFFSLSFAFDPM
jgi:hypothetical protein